MLLLKSALCLGVFGVFSAELSCAVLCWPPLEEECSDDATGESGSSESSASLSSSLSSSLSASLATTAVGAGGCFEVVTTEKEDVDELGDNALSSGKVAPPPHSGLTTSGLSTAGTNP